MSTHLKAFTLFAILIASIGGGSAFAQAPGQIGQMVEAVVITTDKESYGIGDIVKISGEVRELLSGYPITIRVIAANGNIVTLAQLDVNADKTFGLEITSGGPLWKSTGEYTILVLYGTESRTAETTFQFGGPGGGSTGGPSGPTIGVDRTSFVLSYTITGGSVLSVTPDDEANSLIIGISTTSDGELTITLPRDLIDAIGPDGSEDTFFVLIDGEEVDFDETTTSTDRTLTIPFPDGAEEIEIIGSFVVPEFGTIAALILAIAIISIIAVSSKTKLSILPKY
jgi:predicted secreted protein with PEFG-CTERM motif